MLFKKRLGNVTNFRLFFIIGFLVLLIISLPLTLGLVLKTQDTRSKASEVNFNKIKFRFSIEGVEPSSNCLSKTNNLTFDIVNPISKSSQLGITASFSPVDGLTNSKGYQVFQTKEVVLNSSFSPIDNFNYVKIKIPSLLRSVFCIDHQKEKQLGISDCNLNLTNDTIYDFSEYPLISGDINNDGVANNVDLTYVKNQINPGKYVSCGIESDFNFNGIVNAIDFSLIKKNILATDEEISTSTNITPTIAPTIIPTTIPTQTISPTEKPTVIPTITPTSVVTKILFVGNSKTYRASIPKQSVVDIFSNMAKNGNYGVEVIKATIDGSTLLNTANVKQSLITSKAFDMVVLQEQTGSIEKADTSTFLNGVKKIQKLVTNKNANVRIFLRTSWGLKANLGTSTQTRMYSNVDTVASSINATIIPDGKTFDASLKTYPSIKMYSDSTHQSYEGAYLAAACIYKIVFGSDPRQLTYYGYIEESTAKKMQEIANETCK